MSILHLSICGVPMVTRAEDGAVLTLSPRRLLFLTYLAAAAPHGAPRERLLELFWPGSGDGEARNALKQLVFAIRRQVGNGRLLESSVIVRLHPEEISCDLWDVREAARQRDHARVRELVRGTLLDGVHEWQSTGLDHWLTSQRATLERLRRDADRNGG